jgi:hypothetical protein
MTNIVKGLLTNYGSTSQVELSYYFVVSGNGYVPKHDTSSYFFIGRVQPWDDETNPQLPSQSQIDIKTTFKNMIAAKLLTSSNMSPVVRRIDWKSGTVYNEYRDTEDMFARDNLGNLTKTFYVRNRFDQIFKCLFNKDGSESTVEPILQAGTTEPSQTLYLADGYKWIYITTINKGLKKNFFDNDWMPITIGYGAPNAVSTAGLGAINAINVTNSGDLNYTDGITTTSVTITGDGQGCSAYANVSNSFVSDIIVTNSGNNYTFATVTIQPTSGYGGHDATAIAVISPVGGHGADPVSELGCNRVMFSVELDGSESGTIPTDISFRQLGIVVNPELIDGSTPTGTLYNTTDLAYVSFGSDLYTIGERVYQGDSLLNSTYSAEVCSFDSVNNIIYLINIVGTYTIGQPVYAVSSGTTRILLNYTKTDFSVGSGYMMYYENRTPVQRSIDGNEQLRLLLSF